MKPFTVKIKSINIFTHDLNLLFTVTCNEYTVKEAYKLDFQKLNFLIAHCDNTS